MICRTSTDLDAVLAALRRNDDPVVSRWAARLLRRGDRAGSRRVEALQQRRTRRRRRGQAMPPSVEIPEGRDQ